ELVGTVTSTFLGLTVNCCRCHDHKFDPLPQSDYYRIKAVFDGVDHRRGPKDDGSRSILLPDELQQLASRKAPLVSRQKKVEAELAKLQAQFSADLVPTKEPESLVKGQHGSALNARKVQATTGSRASYHKPPLTVECWALAGRADQFNVFVANNLKSSGEHWELYSFAGPGDYSVYMPGYEPATIRSGVVITDGKWHYLAMQFNGQVVKLYVDGKQVKEQPVKRVQPPGPLGTLDIGGYTAGRITCDGAVDEVRISSSIQPVTEKSPGPFKVTRETVGLWRFDRLEGGRFADVASRQKNKDVESLRARQKELQQQQKSVKEAISALASPLAYIGSRRQPPPTHVLLRGDIEKQGPPVTPGGVSAFSSLSAELELAADAPEAERRQRFARWLTDQDNPLTARVLVNRIWQFHFGNGLVKTASDLGFNGGTASHPQLLDWLASEFMRSGWSIKHVHRLILESATYHQSTRFAAGAAEQDAENRLLWRFTPRRLEAEVIRDTMLQVSGALDETMHGPSFKPFTVTTFNTHFYHLFDSDKPQFNRRTVYRANVITGRDPLLDCFDCPSPSIATPRRRNTITPTQALALMNNSFVLRQSKLFARRVEQLVGPHLEKQVVHAFERALTRKPGEQEKNKLVELGRQHGLANVCWVLLNSSEFLYSN
ncbi:MAG: DUF1553 domain-containing protein, partial [Pirellulaceae bacterium]